MQIFESAPSFIFALGKLGYDNTPHFKGFPLLIPGFCLLVIGLFGISFVLRRWSQYPSLRLKISTILCGGVFVVLGVLCWFNPFVFGKWIWPDPEGETMWRLGRIETCIFNSIHIQTKEKPLREGFIPSIFLNEKERNPQSFLDPWGHPIILLIVQDQNERKFLLASAGADGYFHTNDDLSLILDEEIQKHGRWKGEAKIPPILGPTPTCSATVCLIQPLPR